MVPGITPQDVRDMRSGAFRVVGGLIAGAVIAALGALWAAMQKMDWLVIAILIAIGIFLGFFAVAVFLDWRDERKPRSRWSPYAFYRDASNEALAIGTRNVLNPGNAFDVAVDHGILLGKVDSTLRANGLGHEADAIYPYKNPRHVPDFGPDTDPLFKHRRMLQELSGRLAELRDKH